MCTYILYYFCLTKCHCWAASCTAHDWKTKSLLAICYFSMGGWKGRGCKIARLLPPSSYTTVTHIEKRSSMSASWKSSASFRLAVSGEPWAACRHRHAAGSVVPLLPGAVVGIRVLQRPLALIHPLLATTIMLCHRQVVLLCTAPMRVRSPSRPGRP